MEVLLHNLVILQMVLVGLLQHQPLFFFSIVAAFGFTSTTEPFNNTIIGNNVLNISGSNNEIVGNNISVDGSGNVIVGLNEQLTGNYNTILGFNAGTKKMELEI